MALFYRKESADKNEEYLPIVDMDPRNIDGIKKSIETHAIHGGRVLYSSSGLDAIEMLEGILKACPFVNDTYAHDLVNYVREIQDDVYKYLEQIDDLKQQIEEVKNAKE